MAYIKAELSLQYPSFVLGNGKFKLEWLEMRLCGLCHRAAF